VILIPAVDILGGRPVRLLRGEYDRVTRYGDSPLDAALRWKEAGARWLHVVDLDAARSGEAVNAEAVRSVVQESGLRVQVGGGLRTEADVERVLGYGAKRAVLGTAAVEDPELLRALCKRYPGRIVVALDARHGEVTTRGWLEGSGRGLHEMALQAQEAGAARILFTAIEVDGGLGGPDIAAIQGLVSVVEVPVIASGGVGSVEHLEALERTGAEAVIVGRALYEGTVPPRAVLDYSRGG
jgi:phosphoribosylformimino-5-aminoimidazole carboxamide ribotide isomerase